MFTALGSDFLVADRKGFVGLDMFYWWNGDTYWVFKGLYNFSSVKEHETGYNDVVVNSHTDYSGRKG
jgi:hypothetical protein